MTDDMAFNFLHVMDDGSYHLHSKQFNSCLVSSFVTECLGLYKNTPR